MERELGDKEDILNKKYSEVGEMVNMKKALKKEVEEATIKLGQEQHQHNKTRILYEEQKIKIENYK